MEKVRLNVLGISYGHSESGSYILLLGEQLGTRKLPIVITPVEVQAIAVQLEGYNSPRPLTHELFLKFSQSFGIELVEVNITKIESGVFYAELLFFDGDRYVTLDARPSDAISIALRFRCPIFTTKAVLDETAIEFEEEEDTFEEIQHDGKLADLKSYSVQQLESLLKDAVDNEEYELAGLIRDELRQRNYQQ